MESPDMIASGPTDVDDEYRHELTAYCYRVLASGSEAEDAVQETMVRAWRANDAFQGRASRRTWLYKIATNVCLDMLRAPQRRAQPMDLAASVTADSSLGPALAETVWVQPVSDAAVIHDSADPAELAATRESIRLAFVSALQHLPPRQRAVLVLREVLDWPAAEVAELLGASLASVNSALARARGTLAKVHGAAPTTLPDRADQRSLLDRYVAAFESYDVDALVSLLHADATFSMPPYQLWLRGPAEVARWYVGQGSDCRGSRLVPTAANGCPAFGAYHPAGSGRWEPFALHVLEIRDGLLSDLHHFLDTGLFPDFGLPPHLTA